MGWTAPSPVDRRDRRCSNERCQRLHGSESDGYEELALVGVSHSHVNHLEYLAGSVHEIGVCLVGVVFCDWPVLWAVLSHVQSTQESWLKNRGGCRCSWGFTSRAISSQTDRSLKQQPAPQISMRFWFWGYLAHRITQYQ